MFHSSRQPPAPAPQHQAAPPTGLAGAGHGAYHEPQPPAQPPPPQHSHHARAPSAAPHSQASAPAAWEPAAAGAAGPSYAPVDYAPAEVLADAPSAQFEGQRQRTPEVLYVAAPEANGLPPYGQRARRSLPPSGVDELGFSTAWRTYKPGGVHR